MHKTVQFTLSVSFLVLGSREFLLPAVMMVKHPSQLFEFQPKLSSLLYRFDLVLSIPPKYKQLLSVDNDSPSGLAASS